MDSLIERLTVQVEPPPLPEPTYEDGWKHGYAAAASYYETERHWDSYGDPAAAAVDIAARAWMRKEGAG